MEILTVIRRKRMKMTMNSTQNKSVPKFAVSQGINIDHIF